MGFTDEGTHHLIAETFYNKGQALTRSGKDKQAEECFDKAREFGYTGKLEFEKRKFLGKEQIEDLEESENVTPDYCQ